VGNKGFSIAELLVSLGIALIVFAIIGGTYVTTQRLWRGGFSQITFQSLGRVSLDKICRSMRSATGATILDSGNRVRFVTDPNRTPQDASDDITREYYVSGTDIIYDPNVSVSGDQVTLLRNVNAEPGIPFFQLSGRLAVITFKVFDNNAFYGAHWASMSTSVTMRNA